MFKCCGKVEINWSIIPVGFAEVLEVVHVAASGRVLSIFGLPLFGISDLQQVSVVLHYILALLETPSGKHCSSLSFYMLHLQNSVRGFHHDTGLEKKNLTNMFMQNREV